MSVPTRIRLSYFLVFCCTAAWLPLLADYCVGRGLQPLQVSLILSITPLSMFLFQPFAGFLADRFGYRRTLSTTTLLAAFSYLGFLVARQFWSVALVTVAMSLFYNAVQPILDSISLKWIQKDHRLSYGKLRVAGALGWSATGLINGQLIEHIDLSVIFWISFTTMLLCFISVLQLPANRDEEVALEKLELKGAFHLLGNTRFLMFLLAVFFISTAGTVIWNYYSLFLKTKGADQSWIGYGLSLQGLCEIPFFYFSAWIIARWGLKKVLLITILATALRLFLYGWVDSYKWVLPIELLHGISWSLFWVVSVEFVDRLVPAQWLATGQSLLYASYYGIGAIAGNLWAGYLLDAGSALPSVFQLNVGFVILAFLLSLIAVRTSPRS